MKYLIEFLLCVEEHIVVASLQDGPQWPSYSGIHTFVQFPSTLSRADLCYQKNFVEMMCDFFESRPFFLNCNFYLDLSLNIHSVESQLPCWEDISNLLERSTWWGTEVSCQQPAQTCQPHAQAIWEQGPPASSKPSDNCSPSWHFDFNLMREL